MCCQRWFLSPKQDRICCTDCTCIRWLCRCVILLSHDPFWACALILQHWKYHMLQQILSLHGLLHKHEPWKYLPLIEREDYFLNYLCWSILGFELTDGWVHSSMLQKKETGTNSSQWPMFPVIFGSWHVEFSHVAVKWAHSFVSQVCFFSGIIKSWLLKKCNFHAVLWSVWNLTCLTSVNHSWPSVKWCCVLIS